MKLITPILSLFLASIILYNSLRVSFTYAYYYLDRADFIEMLCENKDKPELKCDGKCHLKKVADNTTKDDKQPFKAANYKEITLFIVEQTTYSFLDIPLKRGQLRSHSDLYNCSVINALDHPPQV